ncbi:MAG: trypsin-like peptidase domain-containing protein [Deltaproteobacteria bacterium]
MSGFELQLSDALAGAVEKNAGSLVRVEARMHRGSTGVVWNDQGVIVTAHHAVERDENIGVVLADGKTVPATLVGRDPGTDLAVLRVETAPAATPAVWRELDGVKVGHLALTLARPGRSVRAVLGIVGAMGTEEFHTPAGGRIDHYVQTDTAPRHGFSGGVVALADGGLIGLNTSGLLRDTNVVIPAVTLRRVVEQLLSHGHPRRGYLGVGVYPVRLAPALEQGLAQRFGAIVVSLEPGSPADRAGILQGDVLVTLDGEPIARPMDLSALLESRVDKTVPVRLVRAGAALEVSITPAARG